MALADTAKAIGAVTKTLREQLEAALGTAVDLVSVGRPEVPTSGPSHPRLNLFLYEVRVDDCLRNESLDDGQPPPLWLVLHYLITGFDKSGESDSEAAHEIVGAGMRALHAINFLQPTVAALSDNPNPLKVTFDAATVDLLSKLMQGPDMKYRFSAAFQIRPILIAAPLPPSYAQLVGIDYTAGGTVIGEKAVQIDVEPSLGPLLDTVTPAKFEPGAALTISGTDLNVEGLSVQLGGVTLPITSRSYGSIACAVPNSIALGTTLSAGSLPIVAVQTIFNHSFSSNTISGGLLPHLTSVTRNPGSPVVLVLNGTLLGTQADSIFVGLAKPGDPVRIFDQFTSWAANQTSLKLTIPAALTPPAGPYRVILRVNGQQALNSPVVTI